MLQLKENSMTEMYRALSHALLDQGEAVNGTHELRNVMFELTDPKNNIATNKLATKSGFPLGYALAELLWYYNADNTVDFIGRFANMWKRLTDDGKTNNSAYGYVLANKHGFNQIDMVVSELKRDPSSRRATMKINTPHETAKGEKNLSETKDEPCTLSLQFLLRDGKLELTTVMRSNDIWFGVPNDVIYFTTLQQYVAKQLGVELGSYIHIATSLHVYDRNLSQVADVITHDVQPKVKLNAEQLFEYSDRLYTDIKNSGEFDSDKVEDNLKALTVKGYEYQIFTNLN